MELVFNSADEINIKAEEFKNLGRKDMVLALAVQNGLDKEDAEDYIAGEMDKLTTPAMAAWGRINIQTKELEVYEIMEDWITYIKQRCLENAVMAKAVMQPDKSIKGCIAELLKWSLKNAKPVDKGILKACSINYNVRLGIPGMRTAKETINKYYVGGIK